MSTTNPMGKSPSAQSKKVSHAKRFSQKQTVESRKPVEGLTQTESAKPIATIRPKSEESAPPEVEVSLVAETQEPMDVELPKNAAEPTLMTVITPEPENTVKPEQVQPVVEAQRFKEAVEDPEPVVQQMDALEPEPVIITELAISDSISGPTQLGLTDTLQVQGHESLEMYDTVVSEVTSIKMEPVGPEPALIPIVKPETAQLASEEIEPEVEQLEIEDANTEELAASTSMPVESVAQDTLDRFTTKLTVVATGPHPVYFISEGELLASVAEITDANAMVDYVGPRELELWKAVGNGAADANSVMEYIGSVTLSEKSSGYILMCTAVDTAYGGIDYYLELMPQGAELAPR